MPLDAEHVLVIRGLDGFRKVVDLRPSGHAETVAHLVDRLMMVRLDRMQLLRCRASRQRSGREPDLVLAEGSRCTAVILCPDEVGHMLLKRAAARDIEQLHPPAYTEQRHFTLNCTTRQSD